jgi:hypothetical protein
MNNHTPGPWGPWTFLGNDGCGRYTHRAPGLEITQHILGTTEPVIHANARLIAASPELLEALKAAEKLLPPDHIVAMMSRDVICKAEGRA